MTDTTLPADPQAGIDRDIVIQTINNSLAQAAGDNTNQNVTLVDVIADGVLDLLNGTLADAWASGATFVLRRKGDDITPFVQDRLYALNPYIPRS